MISELIIGIAIASSPAIIALVLPRRKTIGFGKIIYTFVGSILMQQGSKVVKDENGLKKLVAAVRTTFVDLAFGVYISSRKDLNSNEIENKIEEYLDGK